jgi:hypothetical protein
MWVLLNVAKKATASHYDAPLHLPTSFLNQWERARILRAVRCILRQTLFGEESEKDRAGNVLSPRGSKDSCLGLERL